MGGKLALVALGLLSAAVVSPVSLELVPGAAAAPRKPLVLHFTSITAMNKGSTNCPKGTVVVQGRSTAGASAKARLCLLATHKIRKNTRALISRATISVDGSSGTLKAVVRIFEVTKGSVAHRTITGIIYPGTGAFATSGGRVFGQGTIAFPKKGRPRVDLTFTFGFD
jgi:hypothetical protein